MNATCAYCHATKSLTREHIVPRFLYKKNPLAKLGYNLKADRFLSWEAQIKDVCSRCNNERLSSVDAYLQKCCEANGIDKLITEESEVLFKYDFHWLCRALLKITYNCLRFKGKDLNWIEPFSDYILNGRTLPSNRGVKIGVEVVPCHKIKERERKYLPEEASDWRYLPPHMIRIGQIYGLDSSRIFSRCSSSIEPRFYSRYPQQQH